MPDIGFGSAANYQSWVASGSGPSCAIPMPSGRQMASGDRSVLVTNLGFWASGRGANPRGRAHLGDGYTVELVLPASNRADNRGLQPMERLVFVNGGYGNLRLAWLPIFYAWGGGVPGGPTYDNYSLTRPGVLAGSLRYEQAPQGPRMLEVTSSPDGRTSYPHFVMEGDSGGANIVGYRIQIARNPEMTQGVETYDTGHSGLPTIAGRTPGGTYFYRATARTTMTDYAGQLGGEWSAVIGLTQPNPSSTFGRIRRDTSWVPTDGRIRTAAGAWVPLDGRVRLGPDWVPINE